MIDSCTGNWLHHLEWEKGVSLPATGGSKKTPAALKRLWDRKATPAPSSQAVEGALPSDCRHREDLVHLQVRSIAGIGTCVGELDLKGPLDLGAHSAPQRYLDRKITYCFLC